MKARMLAHLQIDGSINLIPAIDVPAMMEKLMNDAPIGTNFNFAIIETDMANLERAPKIGNAYKVSRRKHFTNNSKYIGDGLITTDNGLIDTVLLMELLDLDCMFDTNTTENFAVPETEHSVEAYETNCPIIESCGTPDTDNSFISSGFGSDDDGDISN